MKLIRFGEAGNERPGVIIKDNWFDVSDYIDDYDEEFFQNDGLSLLSKVINESELKPLSKDVRLGSPVARPSKIICIGLNYSDHAKESNMQLPAEPVVFFKATSALYPFAMNACCIPAIRCCTSNLAGSRLLIKSTRCDWLKRVMKVVMIAIPKDPPN